MAGRTTFELSTAASNMAASQLFYFLLVPLLVLWLIYFKLSRRNLNKHAENIPGPPGLPIVGNLLDLMGSSHSKWICSLYYLVSVAPFLYLFIFVFYFYFFIFYFICAIHSSSSCSASASAVATLLLRTRCCHSNVVSFCIVCHHKSVAASRSAVLRLFQLC